MNKIVLIGRMLTVAFALSACSGIGLHMAGHGNSHAAWHNWAAFHILTSLLFFAGALLHSAMHRGWYKSIIRNGIGRKNRATAALTTAFFLLSVTGFILPGISGANSAIGVWHYKIGIVTSAIAVGHILKRISFLCKSVRNRRS